MGLTAGEPPEFWITDHPDRVMSLHQKFVDAGADIVLTNTFGCNRHRLKLHNAQSRVHELASAAAQLARKVADNAGRPVIVAGSVGPTGELFEPLGALTEAEAIDTFAEQIQGLKDGGADVAWIETMSAPEEVRAAAMAPWLLLVMAHSTCSVACRRSPSPTATILWRSPIHSPAMHNACATSIRDLISARGAPRCWPLRAGRSTGRAWPMPSRRPSRRRAVRRICSYRLVP